METAYTFDDVMFLPQYSGIKSRSEIKLNTRIGKVQLSLPVISANMADITEENMACSMYKSGGLGILHRFMSIEENVEMYNKVALRTVGTPILQEIHGEDRNKTFVGVSVGVGEEAKERFKALYDAGARVFCIDVAHGHHINVQEMIKWTRGEHGNDFTLIAGNVATGIGAESLYSWGADVIKVGIGPGCVCQTRENTGVGVPQLYAIMEAQKAIGLADGASIISDGGIKKTGDIAKALKYADAVMMGGFFAGTTETPGHVYEDMDSQFYKTLAGSASAESKVRAGKDNSFVEGGIRQVPFRGHVKYIAQKVKENVQSSFSYSGCRNHESFQKDSVLIKISGGGKKESKL